MTAIAHDTILEVPLPQLHDSPFNARRLYTGLEELASSITAEGRVLQPLLVRPLAGVPGAYQLVFGHRRLRAAELASLPTVPCMVRDVLVDQWSVEREPAALRALARHYGVDPDADLGPPANADTPSTAGAGQGLADAPAGAGTQDPEPQCAADAASVNDDDGSAVEHAHNVELASVGGA